MPIYNINALCKNNINGCGELGKLRKRGRRQLVRRSLADWLLFCRQQITPRRTESDGIPSGIRYENGGSPETAFLFGWCTGASIDRTR